MKYETFEAFEDDTLLAADLAAVEVLLSGTLTEDSGLTVDEWLDREDLDRLELERLQEDLYPGAPSEGSAPKVHTDRDVIQGWLARERGI